MTCQHRCHRWLCGDPETSTSGRTVAPHIAPAHHSSSEIDDLPLNSLLLLDERQILLDVVKDHPLGISGEESKVLVDEADPNINGHAPSDGVEILLKFDHQHIVADVVVVELGLTCIDSGVLVPL